MERSQTSSHGWGTEKEAREELGLHHSSREARRLKEAFGRQQPPIRTRLENFAGEQFTAAVFSDGSVWCGNPQSVVFPHELSATVRNTTSVWVLVSDAAQLWAEYQAGTVPLLVPPDGWNELTPELISGRPVVVISAPITSARNWLDNVVDETVTVMWAESPAQITDASNTPPWNTGWLLLPSAKDLFQDPEGCRVMRSRDASFGDGSKAVEVCNWIISDIKDVTFVGSNDEAQSEVTISMLNEQGAKETHSFRIPTEHIQRPDRWSKYLPTRWAARRTEPAMQVMSQVVAGQAQLIKMSSVRVYSSTGWVHHDGDWLYLLGGAGIGADGYTDDVQTQEPRGGGWKNWCLDSSNPSLAETWKEVENALMVLRPEKRALVLAAVLRAVVPSERTRSNVSLLGPSGGGKTYLAGLAQSAFGNFSSSSMPFSVDISVAWMNSISNTFRDVLVVLDDLPPEKPQLMERIGEVKRLIFNGTAASRATQTGDVRAATAPSMVLVTTEETSVGSTSVANRNLVMNIARNTPNSLFLDDFDSDEVMRELQAAAQNGLMRRFLASVLPMFAANYQTIRSGWSNNVRGRATSIADDYDMSSRPSETVAELVCALDVFRELAAVEGVTVPDMTADLLAGLLPHLQTVSGPNNSHIAHLLEQLVGDIRSGTVTFVHATTGLTPTVEELQLNRFGDWSDARFQGEFSLQNRTSHYDLVDRRRRVGVADEHGLRVDPQILQGALGWSSSDAQAFVTGLRAHLTALGLTPQRTRTVNSGAAPRFRTCYIPWEILLGLTPTPASQTEPHTETVVEDASPADENATTDVEAVMTVDWLRAMMQVFSDDTDVRLATARNRGSITTTPFPLAFVPIAVAVAAVPWQPSTPVVHLVGRDPNVVEALGRLIAVHFTEHPNIVIGDTITANDTRRWFSPACVELVSGYQSGQQHHIEFVDALTSHRFAPGLLPVIDGPSVVVLTGTSAPVRSGSLPVPFEQRDPDGLVDWLFEYLYDPQHRTACRAATQQFRSFVARHMDTDVFHDAWASTRHELLGDVAEQFDIGGDIEGALLPFVDGAALLLVWVETEHLLDDEEELDAFKAVLKFALGSAATATINQLTDAEVG